MPEIPKEVLDRENKKLNKAIKKVVDLIADHTFRLVEARREEVCSPCPKRDGCPEAQLYAELSYKIALEVAQTLVLLVADEVSGRLPEEVIDKGRKWFAEENPIGKAIAEFANEDKRRDKEAEARYV